MKRNLIAYTVTWRGFKGAVRQALPSKVVAKDRYAALILLGQTLKENGVTSMPASITITRTRKKSAGAVSWRTVGR